MRNANYYGFQKKEGPCLLQGIRPAPLSNIGIYIIWYNNWKLIYSWSPSMGLTSSPMIEYLWWEFGLLEFLGPFVNLLHLQYLLVLPR